MLFLNQNEWRCARDLDIDFISLCVNEITVMKFKCSVIVIWIFFAFTWPVYSQENRSLVDCPANAVAIDLGIRDPSGSIEFLIPIADSDGFKSRRRVAKEVICIDSEVISEWNLESGSNSENIEIIVTYDPENFFSDMRSYLDYSVALCDELDETPLPPSVLRFGVIKLGKGSNRKLVEWSKNLRKDMERKCEREYAEHGHGAGTGYKDVKIGRWTVSQISTGHCSAYLKMSDKSYYSFHFSNELGASFSFSSRGNFRYFNLVPTSGVLSFDRRSSRVVSIMFSSQIMLWRTNGFIADVAWFKQNFLQSRSVELITDGQVVAMVDLAGSSAAMSEVDRCLAYY